MDTKLTKPVVTLDIRDILSQLGIDESKWHDFNQQAVQKEKQQAVTEDRLSSVEGKDD